MNAAAHEGATMHRTTLKGHGNPTHLVYFGVEKAPMDEGIPVTVEMGERGSYKLVNAAHNLSVGYVAYLSSANKFWAMV